MTYRNLPYALSAVLATACTEQRGPRVDPDSVDAGMYDAAPRQADLGIDARVPYVDAQVPRPDMYAVDAGIDSVVDSAMEPFRSWVPECWDFFESYGGTLNFNESQNVPIEADYNLEITLTGFEREELSDSPFPRITALYHIDLHGANYIGLKDGENENLGNSFDIGIRMGAPSTYLTCFTGMVQGHPISYQINFVLSAYFVHDEGRPGDTTDLLINVCHDDRPNLNLCDRFLERN